MQLSQRFLNLVQQQLDSFAAESVLQLLVVYVAQSEDGAPPGLEAVGHWPSNGKALPAVEADPDLRTPSAHRRWYPLQEGSILIGVLRAERFTTNEAWPESLDQRLQATAGALAQCLGLEVDRGRLLNQLSEQREQIGLMVHQLRNPLTALRTYAQLLLRKLDPESTQRSLVEGLMNEQDQLTRYISALDDLTQAKLPALSETTAPLLLPPVVSKVASRNVRSLLEPLIERAAATATLQGRQWHSPSAWPEWTNELRPNSYGVIAEIVANLLENAFRYSPPKSSIGLDLNNLGLCVWDGGDEITLEESERIFQKGFRGLKSSGKTSGSGIGLYIGRQLAKELEGDLELIIPPCSFDNHLPKKGNAFVLRLPAKSLKEVEA